jgi:tRNA A37 threonylcarbamoyladenosine dehydratase
MDYFRQMDLVDQEALEVPMVIIGCGGIGSLTILALAKMGCHNLTVYDDDIIEPHNLPNQVYRIEDTGKKKVEAIAEILQQYTGTKIKAHPERVTGQKLRGLVISGIDTMTDRIRIWRESVKLNPAVPLYIDARMGGEVSRIYAVRPVDPFQIQAYESTLYSDTEADPLPCTGRTIIYNTFAIAGIITSLVKKFLMGEPYEREILFDLHTLTLNYH